MTACSAIDTRKRLTENVLLAGESPPPPVGSAAHSCIALHSGSHHAREPAREALLLARLLILISTTDLPTHVGRHTCTRSTLAIHCGGGESLSRPVKRGISPSPAVHDTGIGR
jgi:hypothetical protein